MKKIYLYIAAIVALVLSVSCTREDINGIGTKDETISIEMVWFNPVTKSAGIDNENKVTSLDYYFFPDSTSEATFHFRESITAPTEKVYRKDFVPGEEYGGKVFPSRSELCGSNMKCVAFVVANLPESKVPSGNPTLSDLQNIAVDESFLTGETITETDGTTRYICMNSNDSGLYFIMTGGKVVEGTYIPLETEPETIELQRLAAKFTFDVKVLKEKDVTIDGKTETWTPKLNNQNVRMYVQNAVTNALLGGVDEMIPSSISTVNYRNEIVSSDNSDWKDSGDYWETNTALGPFYSYPNNWENGGTDTFIKIIVPWDVQRADGTTIQREVYYKVMLPEPKVLANNHYDLLVTLEPGTEHEPEVEINAGYHVANWTTGGEKGVNSALKDIRYLVVDTDEANEDGNFVFYSQSMRVLYSASNEVDFKVMSASFQDYQRRSYGNDGRTITFVDNETFSYPSNTGNSSLAKQLGTLENGDWVNVNTNGRRYNTVKSWFRVGNATEVGSAEGYLTIDHPLCNDITKDFFDLSPYTFTVRVYLKRAPEIYKDVTFVQYPQTYLTVQKSTTKGTDNYSWGYIFINGQTRTNNTGRHEGEYSPWTYISEFVPSDTGNYNDNMYILTTSVLSDKTKYLGDPRISGFDNGPKRTILNDNEAQTIGGVRYEAIYYDQNATTVHPVVFVTAPDADGEGTKTLTNYKPTDEAKSPTFIAPKLRIQSGYGKRGSNAASQNRNSPQRDRTEAYSWGSAWNRCAAYQEDGYPAGRWRLPTEAEIEYVNILSQTRGFIPTLFAGNNYWTATPGVTFDDGRRRDNQTQASTRCVYDDWYWGSEPVSGAQNTFMWGD